MAVESSGSEGLLLRVRGEFAEMPGLRLTEAQACRLWNVDRATCETMLTSLVDAKFLFRTRDGAYMRVDAGVPVKASTRARVTAAA
jgi:hypothetical protein